MSSMCESPAIQSIWMRMSDGLATLDRRLVTWLTTDELTDLQYQVLATLVEAGATCGPDLRDSLVGEDASYNKTAGFYHLVKRMEESGLIVGEEDQKEASGRRYRVRRYHATAKGRERFRETAEQYLMKAARGIIALQAAQ